MGQLKIIAQNITKHSFDYPFYCSRKLDIDEKQQKRSDQHSIRFEHFDGVTVLAVSGNYYGAYAADKFSEELREPGRHFSASYCRSHRPPCPYCRTTPGYRDTPSKSRIT